MVKLRMLMACGSCDHEFQDGSSVNQLLEHAAKAHNSDLQLTAHGYCSHCNNRVRMTNLINDIQYWACYYCHRTFNVKLQRALPKMAQGGSQTVQSAQL